MSKETRQKPSPEDVIKYLGYCTGGSDKCEECAFAYKDYCRHRLMLAAAEHLREKYQKTEGCEYCTEDSEGYRKMFGAFSINNPLYGDEWEIGTGHCKPRQIYFCPMCGRRLSEKKEG